MNVILKRKSTKPASKTRKLSTKELKTVQLNNILEKNELEDQKENLKFEAEAQANFTPLSPAITPDLQNSLSLLDVIKDVVKQKELRKSWHWRNNDRSMLQKS